MNKGLKFKTLVFNIRIMFKLIFRHLSPIQLLCFFISNLVGIFIILAGVQVYTDTKPIFEKGDSFIKQEYVIVSKPVSSINTLTAKSPVFSEDELNDVKKQPFVEDVAVFTPSLFGVYASISSKMLGTSISTDMFFEAVPDKFVDIDLKEWHYDETEDCFPIVIPKNYLNLYNFGFASSQSLPVLSEDIISSIIINFKFYGDKGYMNSRGRIVGFSDRINTILVPLEFLQNANELLTGEHFASSSRMIIEVNDPSDERISKYMADNNYDIENALADASKTKYFLRILLLGVVAVGFMICLLSVYILMLSIFLLLQKLTEHIDSLLLIGYSIRSVAMPYCLISTVLNVVSLIMAFIFVSVLRNRYLEVFASLYDLDESSMMTSIIVGIVLCVVIFVINTIVIFKKIRSIWMIHKK